MPGQDERFSKLESNSEHNGVAHGSQVLPETPRIIRNYGAGMDTVGSDNNSSPMLPLDLDFNTQVENRFHSQEEEELRLLKEKHEELKEECEILKKENRSLQLQLVAGRNQMEEAVRSMETKIEALQANHRAEAHKVKMEVLRQKINPETNRKEHELLQEQLILAKTQKAETVKKLGEVEKFLFEEEQHKRNMDVYLRRQQAAQQELEKKLQRIQEAGEKLREVVVAHKIESDQLAIIASALDEQKDADDAKIKELEEQLNDYKSSIAQLEEKIKLMELQRKDSELRIIKLKTVNDDALSKIQTSIEAFGLKDYNRKGEDRKTKELFEVCNLLSSVVVGTSVEVVDMQAVMEDGAPRLI